VHSIPTRDAVTNNKADSSWHRLDGLKFAINIHNNRPVRSDSEIRGSAFMADPVGRLTRIQISEYQVDLLRAL
jgi:hypothetical protein